MINNDILENTVSARGQLKDSEFIKFCVKDGAKLKVLFVGNSITRHGVKEEIGWTRDCGMAASSLENDYVHLTVAALEKKYGAVSYCITHAVAWEYAFDRDEEVLAQFSAARDFDADIVILRIGENSDRELLQTEDYRSHFEKMAKFFFNSHCKKIVTSLFWRYDPIDIPIEQAAKANGWTYVPIWELGEKAENKALDEFWHDGVAKHPNDRGMRGIADAILAAI